MPADTAADPNPAAIALNACDRDAALAVVLSAVQPLGFVVLFYLYKEAGLPPFNQ